MSTTIQDQIDILQRQQVTIQLLGAILDNQVHGVPTGDLLDKQKILAIRAAVATQALGDEIAQLIDRRDGRGIARSIKIAGP